MPSARRLATLGAIFCSGLALTVALQAAAGSYGAELGAINSDEAPHYINGLLIARYLQSGLGTAPLQFAAAFYRHYPKVSIGHWPPLFYIAEAAWMLVFSASRTSVMVFSAAITTALATVLAGVTLPRHGRWAAAGAAGAFLLLPLVREMTAALLVDIGVALLDLAAALVFVAYLQQPAWRPALWFGLAASAAIMTKGNGLALVLLPPAAIVLTGQVAVLRRWDFWLPAPIVAVLCGPWYVATYALAQDGFFYDWGLAYSRLSLAANAGFLVAGAGLPGMALATIGAVNGFRCRDPAQMTHRRGLVALAVAVFAFQVAVPVDLQSRYMIPLLGPAILLAVAGLADITAWRRLARHGGLVTTGLAVASLAAIPGILHIGVKPRIGMREAAGTVIDAKDGPNRAVLIAAGAAGEGAFVVEMAMADRPPLYLIARGTKFLASADFDGGHYAGRFTNPADLAAAIATAGFGFVVLDTSAGSLLYPHNGLVQQAALVGHWSLVSQQAQTGVDGETSVYRIDAPAGVTDAAAATCSWRPRIAAESAAPQLRKPVAQCKD